MRFRVGFDPSAVLGRMDGARHAAAGVVASNVVSDCTPNVPVEFGALRDSGRPVDHGDRWTVEWGGDAEMAAYARVQYYDESLHHPRGGGPRWLDATRAVRGEAWARMAAEEYARRLRGGGT